MKINLPRHFSTVFVTLANHPSYEHAEIRIFEKTSFGRAVLLSLEYQRNKDGLGTGEWYGGRVKIDSDNVDHTARALRFLRRLEKANGGYFPRYLTPETFAVIESLAISAVYDDRLYEFVPVDKVLPNSFHRYMARDKDDRVLFAVVAESQEEAEKKAIKEAGLMIAEQFSVDRISEWLTHRTIEKGMEVAPDTTPSAILLGFDAEPVEAIV